MFVCWVVSSVTQTPKWISIRPGWEMDLTLEQNPLTSGVDLDEGLDPGIFLQWVNV